MVTSTIILDGNVVVDGISFHWWVRDSSEPVLTVSHPNYRAETEPLGEIDPTAQARAIARRMLSYLRK